MRRLNGEPLREAVDAEGSHRREWTISVAIAGVIAGSRYLYDKAHSGLPPSPPRSPRPKPPFPSHPTTRHHGTSRAPAGRVLHRSSPRSRAPPQSQSGVGVNPQCLETYQQLKLGKKIKYIIFTLSPDNKEIIVAKQSESHNYDEFLADLPEAEPRWAVYDFEYEKEGAGKRNKITFFSWCVCHHVALRVCLR